ncbi:MAG: PSD1 and planctomycete cytochrome C domain-containing protein [Planctomycetota bacterium]|jgi:hypothetical protein
MNVCRVIATLLLGTLLVEAAGAADSPDATAFFEKKIRPLLVKHCYECHSEKAGEQQGGLLLDRRSGWLKGGDTASSVVPGEPDASLLIKAIRYADEDLQMPPEQQLSAKEIGLFERWVRMGAPGPSDDLGDTEFSLLGNQEHLFELAQDHWAFQPVKAVEPRVVDDPQWNGTVIDRFVFAAQAEAGLTPSSAADPRTLYRRLSYGLKGLPPTQEEIDEFTQRCADDRNAAVENVVDQMLASQAFGEHFGRLWLDVARYADTDSFYRPDTRTPHYFPFAFTYRDYVIESFNADKPVDTFIREQFAADLMGFKEGDRELAALGFLAVGPYADRDQLEALDDWIDLTTRGLMGITAACARCHDHKYEPVPTEDYYALRGVFASLLRVSPIDDQKQPTVPGYEPSPEDRADYEKQRKVIEAKINKAGSSKAKNNNRSVARKIRETELAKLLLFHPGAPAHAMVVRERPRPVEPVVFVRGDATNPGQKVARRFLQLLDSEQQTFSADSSGRLDLAKRIVDPQNPLTARVFVNRVWGYLHGSHLVGTPSDFGIQGAEPTHPELLDWLTHDFVSNGWSLKRLVRKIVLSRTWQQKSDDRPEMSKLDPLNTLLWRANRRRLSIEAVRDSVLAVAGQLDRTAGGRAAPLWDEGYTRRRAIYGYINRFNLDPTLRAFDFPTPMQSQPARNESIVAAQALFTMNAPFVIDQSIAVTERDDFTAAETDADRLQVLCSAILQRQATAAELERVGRFIELQVRFNTPVDRKRRASTWPLIAQSLMMSNEFQYID